MLMMCPYLDLGSPSDWIRQIFNRPEPPPRSGSTLTCHQYKIYALMPQTSFCRETSGVCQIFCQVETTVKPVLSGHRIKQTPSI